MCFRSRLSVKIFYRNYTKYKEIIQFKILIWNIDYVIGGLLSLKLASNMLQSFCIIVAISEFKVGHYMLGYLITGNHNNLIAFEMFPASEHSPTMIQLLKWIEILREQGGIEISEYKFFFFRFGYSLVSEILMKNFYSIH